MLLLKTVRSHAGIGRVRAEFSKPIGFIPRVKSIPSPYASSPTDVVYEWKKTKVIVRETSHKVYQLFEVPVTETIYQDEEDATRVHILRCYPKLEIQPFDYELDRDGLPVV